MDAMELECSRREGLGSTASTRPMKTRLKQEGTRTVERCWWSAVEVAVSRRGLRLPESDEEGELDQEERDGRAYLNGLVCDHSSSHAFKLMKDDLFRD